MDKNISINKELVKQLIDSNLFRKDWAEGRHMDYVFENLNRYNFSNYIKREIIEHAIVSAFNQLDIEMKKDFIARVYPEIEVRVSKTKGVDKIISPPTIPKFVDKLFKGAPLVVPLNVDGFITECVQAFQYKSKEEYYIVKGILDVTSRFNEAELWENTRLPTIDEAPKNEWLIPWDEKPKELEKYSILVEFKNNTRAYYQPNSIFFNGVYDGIRKIMIL